MSKKLHPNVTRGVLPDSNGKLSEKSIYIFRLMSVGKSADEICLQDPAVSKDNIARAAREALILNSAARGWHDRLQSILEQHPRAYEKWTHQEEQTLIELYNRGKTLREIAAKMQRQPHAIKQRMERLGLFT